MPRTPRQKTSNKDADKDSTVTANQRHLKLTKTGLGKRVAHEKYRATDIIKTAPTDIAKPRSLRQRSAALSNSAKYQCTTQLDEQPR